MLVTEAARAPEVDHRLRLDRRGADADARVNLRAVCRVLPGTRAPEGVAHGRFRMLVPLARAAVVLVVGLAATGR